MRRESARITRAYNKDSADLEIEQCLDGVKPVSFFLFAGAGSGKTGALVSALKHILDTRSHRLRQQNQKAGVITYTVAASEEIAERIDSNPLVEVSTIHSFVWNLIRGFDTDIKKWVQPNLRREIEDLEEKESSGRAGKASDTRRRKIASKQKRLQLLPSVRRFTYNPNGENRGRDSLNHAEVIKIGAAFLADKPLMRSLLVTRYPILFIDESQDTLRVLMEAFLQLEEGERERFQVGLFGDMMQRIYFDGKADLGNPAPNSWATPAKLVNHRSPKRVITLINKIRLPVDAKHQQARSDAHEGTVRLFIAPAGVTDKPALEQRARERMATVASDPKWTELAEVKTLTMEHRMAAARLGFWELFSPLYAEDSLKTSLLEGTLAGLRMFSQQVLPLVQYSRKGDRFGIAAITRNYSPLLSREALERAQPNELDQLRKARDAVALLTELFANGQEPTFGQILAIVHETGLFEVPPVLRAAVESQGNNNDDDIEDPASEGWKQFLAAPFKQIEPYVQYVEGNAPFGTHQGVKGREFPRVLVIMDDQDAGTQFFRYQKLFGAEPKSQTDLKNEREGKETTIDRTRRLLYVTCSRAMSSLGLVIYSSNEALVRAHAITQGWFAENEIESLH